MTGDSRYAFDTGSLWAPAIRRLLTATDPRVRNASLLIDRGDDMLVFGAAQYPEGLALVDYFRTGLSMMHPIREVANWRFGGLERVGSFLDFAAGYGRSTRFLVEHLPPRAVTVCEIQRDALAFQAKTFGVATMQSTSDPADLRVTSVHDMVFAASLFTHLPRRTFGPWLAKVWETVAPGGVLLFSTHDEELADEYTTLQDGFAFRPRSEISVIDTEEYGTCWATPDFVRGQMREWIGDDAQRAIRLPRGLAFAQDLWVVPRGPTSAGPLQVEHGPLGAVDRFLSDGRSIDLYGWAVDPAFTGTSSRSVAGVELSVTDGTMAAAELGHPRADVAAVFKRSDDRAFAESGYRIRAATNRLLRQSDIITVTASSEHGNRFVLDSAFVGDLLARSGGWLPPAPLERRLHTARLVYETSGTRGLVRLAPAVVGNEWRRLRRRVADRHDPSA